MKTILILITFILSVSAWAHDNGAWPTPVSWNSDSDNSWSMWWRDAKKEKNAAPKKKETPQPKREEVSHPGSIFTTNMDEVTGSPVQEEKETPAYLDNGLYEIGGFSGHNYDDSEYYMFFQKDVNNPFSYIAIIMPKEIREKKRARGYIMVANPFANSGDLILTNMVINQEGNVTHEGMYQQRGPAIRIISAPGNKEDSHRHRFYLKGNHPLLKGENIWVMKSSYRFTPRLGLPENGVFGRRHDHANILVSGNEVSFGDTNFKMTPVKSTSGALFSLKSSETNIMGAYEETSVKNKLFAAFIENCWDDDVIIKVEPRSVWSEGYDLTYFKSKDDNGFSIIDFIESLIY